MKVVFVLLAFACLAVALEFPRPDPKTKTDKVFNDRIKRSSGQHQLAPSAIMQEKAFQMDEGTETVRVVDDEAIGKRIEQIAISLATRARHRRSIGDIALNTLNNTNNRVASGKKQG